MRMNALFILSSGLFRKCYRTDLETEGPRNWNRDSMDEWDVPMISNPTEPPVLAKRAPLPLTCKASPAFLKTLLPQLKH